VREGDKAKPASPFGSYLFKLGQIWVDSVIEMHEVSPRMRPIDNLYNALYKNRLNRKRIFNPGPVEERGFGTTQRHEKIS
jgi:hypothetical protein